MKRFFVCFALFAALIFAVGCGGGSKNVNQNDEPDTGETVTDGDTADSESSEIDPSDSGHENPDTTPDNPDSDDPDTTPDAGDSVPDNGDTTPDNGDSQPDDDDTIPDDGDTEPDNDYPQTPCDPNPCTDISNSNGNCNVSGTSYVCGCKSGYIFEGTLCIKSLPECSPTSDTPCIDSSSGLIWSAKSENKMPWNDAVNYCQNLTEGDFNDWRLPSIAVLKTLVQNCSSAQCTDDYTGKYSKFGDTVYLWSASENEDSTAQSIYFSNASTQPVGIDDNINVRCVRREAESRQSNCTGLIENSVWNTTSQITQTWDWETLSWTPSPKGCYNTDASSSECRFKCDSSSFWDGSSKCLNPCEPNPCTLIGETGTCVGKSAKEYRCECEDNYFWNPSSNKCIKNLCLNNPCNIPNSTGTCSTVTETQYACECEDNYFWDSSTKKCVNPCDANPCAAITNSVCTATGASEFSCSGGTDPDTGLTWSARASTTYTWQKAVNYCNSYSEGGLSGWRLPKISELRTLIQNCSETETGGSCGVTDYCLSNGACCGCSSDLTGKYSKFGDTVRLWSSSTITESNYGNRYAWDVDFSDGSVYQPIIGGINASNSPTREDNVRCVR